MMKKARFAALLCGAALWTVNALPSFADDAPRPPDSAPSTAAPVKPPRKRRKSPAAAPAPAPAPGAGAPQSQLVPPSQPSYVNQLTTTRDTATEEPTPAVIERARHWKAPKPEDTDRVYTFVPSGIPLPVPATTVLELPRAERWDLSLHISQLADNTPADQDLEVGGTFLRRKGFWGFIPRIIDRVSEGNWMVGAPNFRLHRDGKNVWTIKHEYDQSDGTIETKEVYKFSFPYEQMITKQETAKKGRTTRTPTGGKPAGPEAADPLLAVFDNDAAETSLVRYLLATDADAKASDLADLVAGKTELKTKYRNKALDLVKTGLKDKDSAGVTAFVADMNAKVEKANKANKKASIKPIANDDFASYLAKTVCTSFSAASAPAPVSTDNNPSRASVSGGAQGRLQGLNSELASGGNGNANVDRQQTVGGPAVQAQNSQLPAYCRPPQTVADNGNGGFRAGKSAPDSGPPVPAPKKADPNQLRDPIAGMKLALFGALVAMMGPWGLGLGAVALVTVCAFGVGMWMSRVINK